ncbi:alpha-ketoglutarate-dependent dioxygenase AlkB, partial [Corynebacterium nasicanis]
GAHAAPIPPAWTGLAQRALLAAAEVAEELAPWADGSFRAEATLVNYYRPEATMGLHVDANEAADAPVISLSIGDEALFRIGHTEGRTHPWNDVTLMSGDLIVFGGPARRAYHGVPAVRPGTAPAGCGLGEGRLNITIRQVERTEVR